MSFNPRFQLTNRICFCGPGFDAALLPAAAGLPLLHRLGSACTRVPALAACIPAPHPRPRVHLTIPLTAPAAAALIVLLDRFRRGDESGLHLTPNRANHHCPVAHGAACIS